MQGPCASYDTACSATLVATHAGLRALQRDECDVGLVAGSVLMCVPAISLSFAIAGMTSARGRCHTFDKRADGYVRSEGCGALALLQEHPQASKLLSPSGSAVRQDGR
eukprot:2004614-Prymnesium_polylepis.1